MRLKLICCEVLYREACAAVAHSRNQVDVEFLPKGLHDMGAKEMARRVAETTARVDESAYEAILFGYGLCNNGLCGLTARSIPLVVPRAHDCITLFLGSKERYLRYFYDHPGVYFLTTGWMERGDYHGELSQLSIQHLTGMNLTYQQLCEKYGEDNARYLHEQLCDMTRNYRQFTFIEMGIEPDGRFEEEGREEARQRGWSYEKIPGDLSLIQRLVDGPWNQSEFLVVPPGNRIKAHYDEEILDVEPL